MSNQPLYRIVIISDGEQNTYDVAVDELEAMYKAREAWLGCEEDESVEIHEYTASGRTVSCGDLDDALTRAQYVLILEMEGSENTGKERT